jgi:L-lactate utilization protein LutC
MDYNTLASADIVEKTVTALKANNFDALVLDSKAEALEKIKMLIPLGASVMNGSSTTLKQIGFIDYLKDGAHGWKNLHAEVLAEKDETKQAELRKHAVVSDYYLGSAHVVTQDGQLVFASNTGSQLPHLAYTSPNIILVVSTKKIVPDLTAAWKRIDDHILALEDARMKEAYGFGTTHAKTLILHKENPSMGRKVLVLFVNEDLGF